MTRKRQTVRPDKIESVQQLKSEYEKSDFLAFTNCNGLSVTKVNELRKSLNKAGASMKVVKNTLSRISLAELGVDYPAEYLKGPSAVVFSEEGIVEAAKALADFAKTNELFSIKGGLLKKEVVSFEGIQALSKLPSRDVLLAKLVGSLKSPLYGLVTRLSSPINGLVFSLKAIERKKQEEAQNV